MPNVTIVDAAEAIPNAGQLVTTFTIQRDSAAMDLTGKTVTATVRAESAPATVIDASLEDHAFAVTDAANGVGTLTLSNAELALLSAPYRITDTLTYLVHIKVSPDNYFPQPYRLYVYSALD